MSPMNEFICTVHNMHFGVDRKAAPGIGCPVCAREELNAMRGKLDEAERHRDLLLSVIEIKKTVVPVKKST